VTSDSRLADVVSELEAVGISCLVMGGHAVRYYGLARNTDDADLHISPGQWDDLAGLLARTKLYAGQEFVEGPSWRPGALRRFRMGTLRDGRGEWLEFWKDNHLLPPYEDVRSRAERVWYGGRDRGGQNHP
jgi:hypothetical protein